MRGRDRAPRSPAEGTAVVTRTERTDVTDAEAPPGEQLCYSVFAARGGDTWSPPASAPPATFTPEVADLSVVAADTSVAATWRAHSGANRVIVVRREDDPPRRWDDGTARRGVTERVHRDWPAHRDRVLLPDHDVLPDAGRPAPLLARRHHAGGPRTRPRGGRGPARHRAGRRRRGDGGHLDAATVRPGAADAQRRAAALARRHPCHGGRRGRPEGGSRSTAPRHRRPRRPRTAPAARTPSHPGPDRRPQRLGGRQHGGSPHGRIRSGG